MSKRGSDDQILDAVETHREKLFEAVSAAVRVSSVSGQEGNAASFFSNRLQQLGFEVQTDCVSQSFAGNNISFVEERDLANRPNVYAWHRSPGSNQAPLVLNGHIDVVPTGDAGLWTHAPFSGNRSEGYIWGRGSADMKGGLLCGIFAVHALREVGISLNRDIQIQCVVGEETTSIGSHYALATQPRPSAVIVLEPSDNCVISTCGGSMHFEIEAYGRAAHTAVSWTGHSAMETLWDIYSGLKTWSVSPQNPVVPPPDVAWPRHDPFAVGRFQGGEWLATLPESAQMIGRIGVHPSQTIEQLKGAFEKAFSDISARSANASRPAMVRWLDQGTPSWTTSPAEDLVRSLLEANYLAGGTDRPHGATYGSDAAVFASAGIPTVLFGPGTISDAHVVDEKVSEEALISATRTLALAIARIASRDGR